MCHRGLAHQSLTGRGRANVSYTYSVRRGRVNRIGSGWLRSLRERLGKDRSNMHSRASAAVRDLCPAARAVGNDARIERGIPDGRKQ